MVETIFWIFAGLAIIAIIINVLQNANTPGTTQQAPPRKTSYNGSLANRSFHDAREWAESGQAYRENKAFQAKLDALGRINKPLQQLQNIGLINEPPRQHRPDIFINDKPRPDGFHRKWIEHEPIAGACHYQHTYESLYNNPQAELILVPEPDNKFDTNAIAVKAVIGAGRMHLGYLSKRTATRLRREAPDHIPRFVRATAIFPQKPGKSGGARIEIWLPRRDLWSKYQ